MFPYPSRNEFLTREQDVGASAEKWRYYLLYMEMWQNLSLYSPSNPHPQNDIKAQIYWLSSKHLIYSTQNIFTDPTTVILDHNGLEMDIQNTATQQDVRKSIWA